MHRPWRVGSLARDLAVAVQPGPGDYAPRLLCFSALVDVVQPLAPGWDPDRYEVGVRPIRWWRRLLRRLRLGRRAAPGAVLFVAATPTALRVTLGGVPADTSRLQHRR